MKLYATENKTIEFYLLHTHQRTTIQFANNLLVKKLQNKYLTFNKILTNLLQDPNGNIDFMPENLLHLLVIIQRYNINKDSHKFLATNVPDTQYLFCNFSPDMYPILIYFFDKWKLPSYLLDIGYFEYEAPFNISNQTFNINFNTLILTTILIITKIYKEINKNIIHKYNNTLLLQRMKVILYLILNGYILDIYKSCHNILFIENSFCVKNLYYFVIKNVSISPFQEHTSTPSLYYILLVIAMDKNFFTFFNKKNKGFINNNIKLYSDDISDLNAINSEINKIFKYLTHKHIHDYIKHKNDKTQYRNMPGIFLKKYNIIDHILSSISNYMREILLNFAHKISNKLSYLIPDTWSKISYDSVLNYLPSFKLPKICLKMKQCVEQKIQTNPLLNPTNVCKKHHKITLSPSAFHTCPLRNDTPAHSFIYQIIQNNNIHNTIIIAPLSLLQFSKDYNIESYDLNILFTEGIIKPLNTYINSKVINKTQSLLKIFTSIILSYYNSEFELVNKLYKDMSPIFLQRDITLYQKKIEKKYKNKQKKDKNILPQNEILVEQIPVKSQDQFAEEYIIQEKNEIKEQNLYEAELLGKRQIWPTSIMNYMRFHDIIKSSNNTQL